MNAGMERAMNSKNLGARIAENGALDKKTWAFEVLGENGLFKRLWGISGMFRVAGGSWCKKTRAYAKFGKFSGIVVEFWRV
jgi:hypothetical protein